jgi:hypothetical protein
MSSFLDKYLKTYTSGHSDARKMEEMFKNPDKYSYGDFSSQLDKAKYIPQYDDYLGNYDDHEYAERQATQKYNTANSAYLGLRSNLLSDFLGRQQTSKSSTSSNSSGSKAASSLPAIGQDGSGSESDFTPGSDQDPTTYKGLTAAEYEESIDLREDQQLRDKIKLDGRINAMIQSLQNESNQIVQGIAAKASMYSDDRRLEGIDLTTKRDKAAKMYTADRAYDATTDKAKIDGAFGVKLQNIINRGAEDVEKIRGEYGIAQTKISGEYGLERDRIQGATARDVANRERDSRIFGALMSGFWS